MSRLQTVFSYGSASITMELNAHHPRAFDETKAYPVEYDTSGAAYAYDQGAPVVRTEQLEFPAISRGNIEALLYFIEHVALGGKNLFQWLDRGVSRDCRYKALSYQQISPKYWKLTITLEVLS